MSRLQMVSFRLPVLLLTQLDRLAAVEALKNEHLFYAPPVTRTHMVRILVGRAFRELEEADAKAEASIERVKRRATKKKPKKES